MRNYLHLVAGAALASAFGLATAQMTPALPNSPSNSSPSSKTDTTTNSSSSTSSTSSSSGDSFAKLDADHDGSVSKKEASSNKSLTAKWDTLDSNKDGKLDQGEF